MHMEFRVARMEQCARSECVASLTCRFHLYGIQNSTSDYAVHTAAVKEGPVHSDARGRMIEVGARPGVRARGTI